MPDRPRTGRLTSLSSLSSLLYEGEMEAVQASRATETLAPADQDFSSQRLEVRLDRKGRQGRTVTLVSGFQLPAGKIEDIARDLKKCCASGGQFLESAIAIQGDHRQQVVALLRELGFRVRGSGRKE